LICENASRNNPDRFTIQINGGEWIVCFAWSLEANEPPFFTYVREGYMPSAILNYIAGGARPTGKIEVRCITNTAGPMTYLELGKKILFIYDVDGRPQQVMAGTLTGYNIP
jgi:hypothetical protein